MIRQSECVTQSYLVCTCDAIGTSGTIATLRTLRAIWASITNLSLVTSVALDVDTLDTRVALDAVLQR